jgi:imidazolonepropionase-like amidohydrolase
MHFHTSTKTVSSKMSMTNRVSELRPAAFSFALFVAASSALLFQAPTLRAQAVATSTAPSVTAIRAARMLDPKSGAVVNNAVVIVSGERIQSAGSNLTIPAGAKVIDLGNMILLPGLIDCHTHLLQNYKASLGGDGPNMILTVATMTPAKRAMLGIVMGREDLQAGITSVRDVGNSGWGGDVALRDAINDGTVMGPRIFAATRALSDQGGQFFTTLAPYAQNLVEQEYAIINGPDDARRAVRQAVYDGADVIKVIVNTTPRVLSPDEMKAIVDEAHRMGRRVAAHATDTLAILTAVEAGVNSIEHGYRISDSGLRIMAHKGIYLVATDYPADFYSSIGGTDMTPAERQRQIESSQRFAASNKERVNRAMKMGVKIAFGSDEYYDVAGYSRGQASLLTLQSYQEDGMSPLDVIRTATVNAADLLGRSEQLGTIQSGKFADIIAIDGDPLHDAKDLQKVRFVMKGGKVARNDLADRAQ